MQSVAVRLIVERERQRMAFVSATYWDLLGTFAKAGGESFQAELVSVDGRKIPASRDFDPATGKLKDAVAAAARRARRPRSWPSGSARAECRVANVEDKPYTTRPYPPFTTSTLQQEANRKYGFTARRTMQVAQSLYENGHITYMRTDSTNLATVAVEAARDLVASQYGREYLPDRAAHLPDQGQERPGGPRGDPPGRPSVRFARDAARRAQRRRVQALRPDLEADDRQPDGRRPRPPHHDHHRRRRRACSRSAARRSSFPATCGRTSKAPTIREAELADRETVLPAVAVGETLECRELEPKSHTTQPPNRYSEAALTRALEEMGIGRPSTYASIIDTILAREYVFKKGNALVPTWVAFAVSQLLETHLPDLVDYQFTAADGRRARRDQPRRDGPRRLPAGVLLRQRPSRA